MSQDASLGCLSHLFFSNTLYLILSLFFYPISFVTGPIGAGLVRNFLIRKGKTLFLHVEETSGLTANRCVLTLFSYFYSTLYSFFAFFPMFEKTDGRTHPLIEMRDADVIWRRLRPFA